MLRPSRKHACHRLSGVPCHRTLPTARASTRGGPYGSNQCVLCHARPPKRQTATGTNSQYLGRDVSYLPSFASFLTRVQCVSSPFLVCLYHLLRASLPLLYLVTIRERRVIFLNTGLIPLIRMCLEWGRLLWSSLVLSCISRIPRCVMCCDCGERTGRHPVDMAR